MSINTIIKPVSGKHSIKEAVISIFLGNPLVKPERFQSLIEKDFKEKFQQFEPVSRIQFQLQSKIENLENFPNNLINNIGFKFSSFEKGKPNTIIQGVNDFNRTFISYHSLNYGRWASFYEDCKSCFKTLNKIQSDIFVTAFSLHYIDEFLWLDENNEIQVDKIFNEDANNIPREFFNSTNSDFNLTTERKEKNNKYYDRLSIKVEPEFNPLITISHNVTQLLKEELNLSELIADGQFESILIAAHQHNKKILLDILKPDVADLIDLKI